LELYELKKAIKGYFDKNHLSEYQGHYLKKYNLMFNDKEIDVRYWDFFELNHNYDLNSDVKLGSKSLLLKYYESLFVDVEYLDEVNTINQLLTVVLDDYINNNTNLTLDSFNLHSSFLEINAKSLIKSLNVAILKEEMEANYYSLDYDEIIIFQLDIIEKIYSSNKLNKAICFIELPLLTNKILTKIQTIKLSNIKVLVFPLKIERDCFSIKNTFLLNKNTLDLYSEEDIYEFILESPRDISIEQMRNNIIDALNKHYINCNVDFLERIKIKNLL